MNVNVLINNTLKFLTNLSNSFLNLYVFLDNLFCEAPWAAIIYISEWHCKIFHIYYIIYNK